MKGPAICHMETTDGRGSSTRLTKEKAVGEVAVQPYGSFDGKSEETLVPVSALNQYLYCPRRCGLIHIEGLFQENVFTAEGKIEHDRVDDPGVVTDDGVRRSYAVPLVSQRLGLVGKADLVEYREGVPFPVDHKRGKRRQWDNDDVQVCAQGMCLEEMLGISVPAGAVYHVGSRRRRIIQFSKELRALTEKAAHDVHQLVESRRTPPPRLTRRCDGCSMRGVCLPEILSDPQALRAAAEDLYR